MLPLPEPLVMLRLPEPLIARLAVVLSRKWKLPLSEASTSMNTVPSPVVTYRFLHTKRRC